MSSNSEDEILLLPERLRASREKLGLGQRQLARIVGVSSNQMNRYENGLSIPSTVILIHIANKLGVSLDYLVGRSDDPLGYHGQELHPDERVLLEAYSTGDSTTMFMLMYERLKKLGKSPHREEADTSPADG